ncbi:VWD domain-containing protein [Legionella lytica]|uniref:VWD domain-containing protein n=1 Tax=Legionella lytica TaxID=96232 RepID=A0ABW8D331_9GAMM
MKGYNLVRDIIGSSGLLLMLASNHAGATEPQFPANHKMIPQSPSHPSMKELKSWRSSIMRVPRPKNGCSSAKYPKAEWTEVPCVKAPTWPYLPSRRAHHGFVIGNGNDVTAQAASGTISEAIGSFDSVTGVVNEYGVNPYNNVFSPNIFSLQLNSNFFENTPACHGVSGCLGWAQFVYSNASGTAFIQYWLINYGPTCPTSGGPAGTGWISYSNSCYGNSNAVTVTASPPLNISKLNQMVVAGQAAAGGNDTFTMTVGGTAYSTNDHDTVVNLANYWQTAEFNVFGDGNGSAATFNYNSANVAALKVRTAVDAGSSAAPSCLATGYTAETNNLNFGIFTASPAGANPAAIVFTESSTNTGSSACQTASSTGDTHITNFAGLEYDFQATGDFVLAEAGPDFIVQTRQGVPVIDPRWKDTSINKAVAVQMGQTRVAIYVGPTRLVINDQPYKMSKGQRHLDIDGVQIARRDNEYVIIGPKGDSVRAQLFDNGMNTWMNVTVSLSSSMGKTRGLLGTQEGNIHELVTSQGMVLNWPVSFQDLYNLYGESWRVQPDQMLLESDSMVKAGVPERPFFMSDLRSKEAAQAIAVCKASGIMDAALLEACTLDTAVLGDSEKSVKTYLHANAPREVMPRPMLEPKKR